MDAWWKQEQHAMAVVDYALACGYLDRAGHREFRRLVSRAQYVDLPSVVADLPVPSWDLVPVTTPVDDHQRDFAVALLDVAAQSEALSSADRKWRTVFARNARTAGDLLVLFVDLEPRLRRRRKDPAMVAGLERLAFVPEILRARGRGRLSRAEFDSFVERVTSGENLDTLRAELDGTTRAEQGFSACGATRHLA